MAGKLRRPRRYNRRLRHEFYLAARSSIRIEGPSGQFYNAGNDSSIPRPLDNERKTVRASDFTRVLRGNGNDPVQALGCSVRRQDALPQ
ncbi:MAG: hypothetical protein JO106_06420 [Mycobacterium sp.]|nr:hypothetical protein [Mycobacterium sp.]